MLGKFAGCLFVWWITQSAWAAGSLTVQFESPAPRELWFSADLPTAAPSASQKTDEKSVVLPNEDVGAKDRLFVWDKTSGLLAELQLSGKKGSSEVLKVGPSAFNRIFRTTVRVEHGGKPVAGGMVQVEDGERKPSVFLAPSDNGEVSFYALRLGQIKVVVQVKSGEQTKTLPAQIFDLTKPTEANPKLTVAVAEDVAVVEPAGSKTAGSKADETPKKAVETPPSRPLGTIVVYLFGLAIVIGGVWFFLHYAKQNPKVVEDNLKKLGVGLPDPNQDGATVDPIPVTPQPQPIQPIILDPNATPDPVAAPVPVGPREPVLIGPGGQRFELAEGSSIVGREAGLAISLVGESSVSRSHAELVRQGERLTVRDSGSTNGTYVNGVKLTGEIDLRPGDLVQFGAVQMRVEG
ncbi:MAG: FHA domain-containing protein [Fimbriimonadaceae bacterium]|nr:FHA domain-containing protein [Fimbriimonadaceae bacterium]